MLAARPPRSPHRWPSANSWQRLDFKGREGRSSTAHFHFFSLFSVCRHVDDFIDKSLVKVGGRLGGWTGAARQTVERERGGGGVDVNPSSRLQEQRSCSYYPANSQTQSWDRPKLPRQRQMWQKLLILCTWVKVQNIYSGISKNTEWTLLLN